MKKSLVISILVFLTFIFLGDFNYLQSSGVDSAELKEAWRKAEKAIEEANEIMIKLEKELIKWQTEYRTIQSTGGTAALQMWNPIDIAKGLFTNAHPVVRLFELNAKIAFVYGQMDELNGILKKRETARDEALKAYNDSTSQKEDKIHTPRYHAIPTLEIPCWNYCGVTFSSSDVGFQNLGNASQWTHKDTCDPYGSPEGCGASYWTCQGIVDGEKEKEKHGILYCGKDIEISIGYNSNSIGVCGISYRKCNPKRAYHKYHVWYKHAFSGKLYPYVTKWLLYQYTVKPRYVKEEHGDGSTTPFSVSVFGPNGTGLIDPVDNSPSCNYCLDGSKNCPNASKRFVEH